jgi:preprotein translocase subunit Sss1
LGVGALILFMFFIVWDLAKRSHAGKFGTVILYAGLTMGILGFLIKVIITYLLENTGV